MTTQAIVKTGIAGFFFGGGGGGQGGGKVLIPLTFLYDLKGKCIKQSYIYNTVYTAYKVIICMNVLNATEFTLLNG